MNVRGLRGIASSAVCGFTLRLGSVFLGLTMVLAVLALVGPHLQPGAARIPWLLAMVAAAISGFTCLRAGRVPSRIEAELIRTAGDPQAWRTIRPLIGAGPVVQAWNGLVEQAHGRQQISEERSMTSASDNQTVLLARAMRSVAAGVAVTGDDFRVSAANPPLAALLGSDDPDELLGRNMLELLSTAVGGDAVGGDVASENGGRTELDAATSAAIERLGSGASAVTVRLCCAAGPAESGAVDAPPQSVWRVSRTRLSGREGDGCGFAWMVQDVTQQAMATAARDQFLQTAAHELRTPLGNLRAYAEALSIEKGVSIEEQKEFCNIINDETTRLSRLVDHLLTVGQMEAGSMVVGQHVVDPTRILEEAVEYLRPQVEASQLTLETEISPKLRSIRGDKDKLQATLVNLIGNAVKYTPAGGHVWVRAALRDETLEIVVQDDGIGISEEDLPRVFEKFYRANSDSVHERRGNGLGLAFVREVARLHNGDITAESQLGEGSVFTLRLPAPDEPTRV